MDHAKKVNAIVQRVSEYLAPPEIAVIAYSNELQSWQKDLMLRYLPEPLVNCRCIVVPITA